MAVRVGFWGSTQYCPGIQTPPQQQEQQRGGRSFVGGKQQVRVIRSGASKETTPPPSVSVVTQKAQKEDDIYSTLRALQSRNRHPKKWLGQVPYWSFIFSGAL